MMGKPFRSIGLQERRAAEYAMYDPLSGYLAGNTRGGYHVCKLEEEWSHAFHVKHAIAVNSATSGLLAASFAIGLKPGDRFVCPAMTMSATCAAPMFTGATPVFVDVEDEMFGVQAVDMPYDTPVFATNLFGGTGWLHSLRGWCNSNDTYLIEDNSQAPFATEFGVYAGTIGHIGVFSLNIHKPLQCGEGGIIVTDDDELAEKMRAFINHGEHVSDRIGLNLRMTELSAAVALAQLQRYPEIIGSRLAQAQEILMFIGDIAGLRPPIVRNDCKHVYYTIPFLLTEGNMLTRGRFCHSLREQGVPVVNGYVAPLYTLPAFAEFKRECPVAESLHWDKLFYIENCAYDFTADEIKKIGAAFRQAAKENNL